MLKYRNSSYRSGDPLIVKIRENIVFGKLFISEYSDNRYYICHNSMDFVGDRSPNLQGYEYSWTFTSKGLNELSDEVVIISASNNTVAKLDYNIDIKLIDFFKSQKLGQEIFFLELDDIFTGYNNIEISDTKGMLKLTNTTTKRFVEIKIGRFINSLVKQINEKHNYNSILDNKQIESISNNFLSFQNDDYIKVETLNGESILEGYKTDNYLDRKSTLGGSCMNNMCHFLKIYTDNPESVSMIVIKTFDKIVGRCLVWNTTCGKKLMDKRYTYADWVNVKFDEIREANNYLNFDEQKKLIVKVNKGTVNDIELYPYMDTFRMLNKGDETLSNIIKGDENRRDFMVLSRTDGSYGDYN